MSVHVTPKLVSTHRGGSMYLTSPNPNNFMDCMYIKMTFFHDKALQSFHKLPGSSINKA